MININKELCTRKTELLTYYRNRASESLEEVRRNYGSTEYKNQARAINVACIETRDNIIKTLLQKAKIEKWIANNNLNEYGDGLDTLYAGGTPLFDEATGKQIDKYDYILKNYPDRPWNK